MSQPSPAAAQRRQKLLHEVLLSDHAAQGGERIGKAVGHYRDAELGLSLGVDLTDGLGGHSLLPWHVVGAPELLHILDDEPNPGAQIREAASSELEKYCSTSGTAFGVSHGA